LLALLNSVPKKKSGPKYQSKYATKIFYFPLKIFSGGACEVTEQINKFHDGGFAQERSKL
jgi:hypothetical protein